jgi:UDP-GlcNAc:undecaprenyl-phosphate/decaprenyl-phosphate GlcNAc-1-phosphate transferase
LILTSLVRRLALKYGFADQPGKRKIHNKPIALGGGIAIFWLTIAPLALVTIAALLLGDRYILPAWLPADLAIHWPGLVSKTPAAIVLILAAVILHVVGLVDDLYQLGAMSKLLVQLAVALLVTIVGNIRFDFFIPIPFIATALSVLWIVVIMNAFNFLDNMDGLSAGVAAICGIILLVTAWTQGQIFVSAFIAMFVGALLGFLVFNFHPATIFMGDAGSLLVGFLMATATISITYYDSGSPGSPWFAALMPLIVLAVPLYDCMSVILLRLLSGDSPFVGDTRHFSHRLVKRGMTQPQAVLTIYLATACTGLGAMLLNKASYIGMILIFIQTIMIVSIIAILEQPGDKHSNKNRPFPEA